MGQEHQFPPPRRSGRCGKRKRSFAGDYLEHLDLRPSDRGTEISDTSCTDHWIAWRVRNTLQLDHLGTVGGPAAAFAGDTTHPDNIIFDFTTTADGGILNPGPNGTQVSSKSGFGHPTCFNNPTAALPPVRNP
jgi:hypothetical protein